MSGAILPLLNTLSWRGAQLEGNKHRGNFSFTFYRLSNLRLWNELQRKDGRPLTHVCSFVYHTRCCVMPCRRPLGFNAVRRAPRKELTLTSVRFNCKYYTCRPGVSQIL
jgi:3-hydroxy-3-methylglutaryl CoA synthase